MITSLASNIVFALFAMVFKVLVMISYLFMGLCQAILKWVTSPDFINMPYTHGGIVDIGWPIVRDFANLGFVLALVWIGLATALRLAEYEAKKALPRLILMVLLVNFTPVIAGIIVDASNIIMNFFLGATGDFGEILNFGTSQYSGITDWLTSFFTKPIALESMTRSLAIYLFNMLAGFFFLLYAALFYVRYVAIWCLVIISPLAFFSYVFPKTSSYYKQWWQQFIQWCFVGVPASFFLYLAWQILDKAETIIIPPPTTDFAAYTGSSDIIGTMLIYSVVLVFLFLGFLTSLSSGAVGATAIIATAKGLGKSAVGSWKKGTGAMGQAKKLGARGGQAIVGSGSVGKVFDDLTKSKNPITSAIGLKGKEVRGNLQKSLDSVKDGRIDAILSTRDSTAATAYFANPLISELNKIKLAEGMAEKWDEEDRMKVREGVDLTGQASRAASWGLVNVARRMVKDTPSLARQKAVSDINIDPKNITDPKKKPLRDDLERIQDRLFGIKTKLGSGVDLSKEEQAMADEISKHFGYSDTNAFFGATDFYGSIVDIINDKGRAYYAIAGELGLERTMAGMKSDSIAGLSNESLNSKRIRQLAALHWTSNKFDNVFQSRGPGVYKDFITGIKDIGTLELAKRNPKLGRAAYSGMLTDKFDKLYTPEGVLIKDAEGWDEYVRFANSDPMNPVPRPEWMGPEPGAAPSTPSTPPSPVSGAPGFVQTPSGLAVPSEKEAPRKTPPTGGKFATTTRPPVVSMPPNPSMSFFSNTLPQITLGDLEKGPMNGYAGGRLLKYENSSMAGIEVHPHSPGMISLRTVLAPGMQGMPKKVRIIADWGSTSINNGQAIPIEKKSVVEIDDKKFTISKNFTLMEIKDKK